MENNKITINQKLSYGCGDLSSNLVWGMTISFLMYYYTDIYLIPAAAAAWILLVPRVVDSFLDPLLGYLIDRTGGHFVLPIIGYLAIPFGLATFLCFLPLPFSPEGKLVWALVSYLVFGIAYSAINVPYGVLSNMIAIEPQERVSLNAFRLGGCQLGQLIVSGATLPLIKLLGGGGGVHDRQLGMTFLMAIIGVSGAGLWIITRRGCKVRRDLPVNVHSFRSLFAALISNRRWHFTNFLCVLNFVVFCSQGGLAIHFTRFVLHRPTSDASFLLASSTFSALLGALGVQFLTQYFGIRRTYLGVIAWQIVMVIILFLAKDRLWLFLPALALQYLAVGGVSPLCFAILADAVDASRARTGIAAAGLAFSINGLISKVAAALTGFALATFLAWGHYTPQMEAAGEELTRWLKFGYLGLPMTALLMALGLVFNSRKDHTVSSA